MQQNAQRRGEMPARELPAAATASRPARRLPAGPSLLLDLMRYAAALLVVVTHLSQDFFSSGRHYLGFYAVAILPVFFLLSGFTIRYATVERSTTLAGFATDRASRIYSAVLPALLWTVLCDALASHANPHLYFLDWGAETTHPALRLLLNSVFLAQAWFHDVAPLSNSPLWYLSYECVFYAIYGIAFYMRGTRRTFAIVLVAALVGPTVLALLPLWLLGTVTYDLYAAGISRRRVLQFAGLAAFNVLVMLGCFLFPQAAHYTQRARFVPGAVSIPVAILLIVACWKLDRLRVHEAGTWIRAMRKLCNSAFALYLIHFPLLVLLVCVFPAARSSNGARLLMLLCCMVAALPMASLFDRLRPLLRPAGR